MNLVAWSIQGRSLEAIVVVRASSSAFWSVGCGSESMILDFYS
jgi:hypothetical protein